MSFRQHNPTTPVIQANANNISKEQLDCGINALGWCRGPSCQKLARLKIFITALSVAAVLQGATETYFRISAKQAALDHDYDPTLVGWLLASSSIFQAVLALFVSYGAQKYHPISWLSGLTMLQGITALGAIIPTATHFPFVQISAEPENIPKLCSNTLSMPLSEEKPYALTTLLMLFVYQIGIGLSGTAIYAIGISYIDDNAESADSPALVGVILGSKVWGSQLGTALSIGVTWTGLGWWIGCAILVPLVVTSGVVLSLFPKKLTKTVVKQAAHRIMEVTTGSIRRFSSFHFIDDVKLVPSLKRLLTNKILMFNITGLIFFQVATVNYFNQEPNYLRSRFYLPTDENNGLTDEWLSRFLSYLLKPPVVGVCILVTGLIFSKVNPTTRSMTAWNIAMGAVVACLFLSYIGIDCSSGDIAGTYRGKLSQPFCSRECMCSPVLQFSPVCPENSTQTYFSPCHAGCTKETVLNDITIYENCKCSRHPEFPTGGVRATVGACNSGQCQLMWILFQILNVLGYALLGTTLVSKVIISLRSVLPQDKSLALSLELMFTGLVTHVPGKLIYDAVSDHTCHYWSQNYEKCILQASPLHGNILNAISAVLILIGLVFDILVYIFTEELDCFPIVEIDPEFNVPLEALRSPARFAGMTSDNESNPPRGPEGNVGANPGVTTPLMNLEESPRRRTIGVSGDVEQHANTSPDIENLDFRMQTPTDTTQADSSIRSISPDDNSIKSDAAYIRELRERMENLQKRRLNNRLTGQETAI